MRSRRLLVTLAAAGLLAAAGAGPATAHPFTFPDENQPVGDGACNEGTRHAHMTVPPGTPSHARIPHGLLGGPCHHNPPSADVAL